MAIKQVPLTLPSAYMYVNFLFQKINSKNAFGLHLIDYMSELLKKKELNNFQVRY